jgi:hypothetical protein
MSMHLEGPWLTTTGRRRGKQKYRSAEQARQARELSESWSQKQKQWADSAPKFSDRKSTISKPSNYIPSYRAPVGRETVKVPSRPDTPGAIASRPADKVYTGNNILGIGTLHKSNAVPIFSDQEAVDIAKMRR